MTDIIEQQVQQFQSRALEAGYKMAQYDLMIILRDMESDVPELITVLSYIEMKAKEQQQVREVSGWSHPEEIAK